MAPPPLPLFRNAINLKELSLPSEGAIHLNHFAFPNLTILELSVTPEVEVFRASQLLDFLEASPMLQLVHIDIIADILLEGAPQERVIPLPNVVAFTLIVDDGGPGYEIAVHISCPSVTHFADNVIPREIFPAFPS